MPRGTLAWRWYPEVALLNGPGQVSCFWPCRYQSLKLNPRFGVQAWSGSSLRSLTEWQTRRWGLDTLDLCSLASVAVSGV